MVAVSFLILLCIDNRKTFDYRGGDNLALRVQERSDLNPIGETDWLSGGAKRNRKKPKCPCFGKGCGCCRGKTCKCPMNCPCRKGTKAGIRKCMTKYGYDNNMIRGGGCDSGCDCGYSMRGGSEMEDDTESDDTGSTGSTGSTDSGSGSGSDSSDTDVDVEGGDSIPVDNVRGLGCGCDNGTDLNMFGIANNTISPEQEAGLIGSVGTNNPRLPPLI